MDFKNFRTNTKTSTASGAPQKPKSPTSGKSKWWMALPVMLTLVFIIFYINSNREMMVADTNPKLNYFLRSYSLQFSEIESLDGNNQIAVLEIIGPILNYKSVLEQIQLIQNTEEVKGVIAFIDSPGGGVYASYEIYQALDKLNSQKTVFAFFASTAASGGYYVSMGAEKIFSSPATITGSIGVVLPLLNIQKFAEDLGIESTPVYAGKYKVVGSIWKQMTAEERQLLQIPIDDAYQLFAETVATKRKLSSQQIQAIAQGQVFTGRQALELELVDELATLEETVAALAQALDLENPELVSPVFNINNNYFQYLTNQMTLWLKQSMVTFSALQF